MYIWIYWLCNRIRLVSLILFPFFCFSNNNNQAFDSFYSFGEFEKAVSESDDLQLSIEIFLT